MHHSQMYCHVIDKATKNPESVLSHMENEGWNKQILSFHAIK